MPCGVTKTLINGQKVVCDNPGTSTHAGQHSAPMSFYGLTIRTYWSNTSTEVTVAGYKRPFVGTRARDNQNWITAPTAAALTAMGMDKSGNWATPSSWDRPTGWVVRSGLTDTEIDNDCLVMNGSGNVRISYRAGHSTSGFGYTVSKRVLKNGEVLHTSSTIDTVHTVDTAVVAGDLIWMELMRSGYVSSSSILGGATNTYLFTAVL